MKSKSTRHLTNKRQQQALQLKIISISKEFLPPPHLPRVIEPRGNYFLVHSHKLYVSLSHTHSRTIHMHVGHLYEHCIQVHACGSETLRKYVRHYGQNHIEILSKGTKIFS